MSLPEKTLEGRLRGVTGKAEVASVSVWFAYRNVADEESTARTQTDDKGNFSFPLPDDQLASARVGADLVGLAPIDLEPAGQRLEPGDVTLLVDDIVPSHIRYGGA